MATSTKKPFSAYEIEMIDRVHARFPNSEPNKFTYFYSIASPFSNFYPAPLEENGIQFHCTEQYMMYHKAKLFHDEDIAAKILQAKEPKRCKGLGRRAQGFDLEVWMDHRCKIVSQGIYLKFTQNSDLKEKLLRHRDSLFVEAAANDNIWGVGLAEENPLIHDRKNWRGKNLLGYVLTDVRNRILDEENS